MASRVRSIFAAAGGDGSDIGAYEVVNHPPVAQCRNVTVEAGANCAADASIDDGSYEPDPGEPVSDRP